MRSQLCLVLPKRDFLSLGNAPNSKPNSQTIKTFFPYRNISLLYFVLILEYLIVWHAFCKKFYVKIL